jgi:hypothetical protein
MHSFVIRGVQNFTPVLKILTPWGAAEGCMNFQHRCKILYTPDYTKITNLFLMKLCIVQNYFFYSAPNVLVCVFTQSQGLNPYLQKAR